MSHRTDIKVSPSRPRSVYSAAASRRAKMQANRSRSVPLEQPRTLATCLPRWPRASIGQPRGRDASFGTHLSEPRSDKAMARSIDRWPASTR